MPVEQQRSLTSSNPILSRPQFRRHGGEKTAARDPRAGVAAARDRIRTGVDLDPLYAHDEPRALPYAVGDLMTMDDVVARAAAALGVTFLVAALSWTVLPVCLPGIATSYGIAAGTGPAAAVAVVIQRHRNRPSAARTLLFAALQGLFLGVLSSAVSSALSPGLLVETVLGTMAVSAGTLLAHRLHWMRVERRFRGFVGAAVLGLCLLALADWMLFPFLGADGLGLRANGLGVITGVVGVAIGACFLSLHFRQVEEGIRHGAPRDRSWPAAFGLTLTLTWTYVECVRMLTLYPAEELY
ncbi:Bax inhibitor-1/YccA family protein [Streptomyces sp. V4-01]|uniref:Bax inhibitor-1/YccA family protein n=1 Tax=Actinacidiphila polyblastidii TaxID=3110430 RepID=A0ABU7PCV7_9ACTN|nr:Bax inhibitor-1/YccA family protein [Streptomyces sp. V4-01]